MVAEKKLYDAIDEIIDSIYNTLKDEIGEGKLLEGINELVIGDRHKTKPAVPAIWIFAETASIAHPPMALGEKWTLPIILSAIIKEDDAELGYREATKYAAKARSVILKNRTLGLRDFVQDTQSSRFEPSAPWLRQGNLFAANAVLNVIFTILERQ